MKVEHLSHRHGGTITEIHAIAHETYKRVADWFFVGTVQWDDKPEQKHSDARIYPSHLCHDGSETGKLEIERALNIMDEYLAEAGKWHEPKTVRGCVVHWTPKQNAGKIQV